MTDFKYTFEKLDPPNAMVTSNEMWAILTKKIFRILDVYMTN